MADIQTLPMIVRTDSGKQSAKQLRAKGQIPCIVYGNKQEPLKLSGDNILVTKAVAAPTIVKLDLDDGTEKNVVIREVQRDCMRDVVLHVDFLEVRMDVKVTATITVEPHGIAIGLSQGGDFEQPVHAIEIAALPADLPERIQVEVAELELGKSITMGEIALPDGVELVSPEPETTIFHIAIPRAEEEEEEIEGAVPVEGDEEGAGGEPEVITKGKKEENEEA